MQKFSMISVLLVCALYAGHLSAQDSRFFRSPPTRNTSNPTRDDLRGGSDPTGGYTERQYNSSRDMPSYRISGYGSESGSGSTSRSSSSRRVDDNDPYTFGTSAYYRSRWGSESSSSSRTSSSSGPRYRPRLHGSDSYFPQPGLEAVGWEQLILDTKNYFYQHKFPLRGMGRGNGYRIEVSGPPGCSGGATPVNAWIDSDVHHAKAAGLTRIEDDGIIRTTFYYHFDVHFTPSELFVIFVKPTGKCQVRVTWIANTQWRKKTVSNSDVQDAEPVRQQQIQSKGLSVIEDFRADLLAAVGSAGVNFEIKREYIDNTGVNRLAEGITQRKDDLIAWLKYLRSLVSGIEITVGNYSDFHPILDKVSITLDAKAFENELYVSAEGSPLNLGDMYVRMLALESAAIKNGLFLSVQYHKNYALPVLTTMSDADFNYLYASLPQLKTANFLVLDQESGFKRTQWMNEYHIDVSKPGLPDIKAFLDSVEQ